MTEARQKLNKWIETIDISGKDVADIGCGSKPVADIIDVSKTKRYVRMDKVNKFMEGIEYYNLENKNTNNREYDIVFCLNVLEHILSINRAMHNLSGIIRIGGVLYLSVPFKYEIHGTDYWRFTQKCIKELLELYLFDIEYIKEQITDKKNNIIYFVKARKV